MSPFTLHNDDCMNALRTMADASVDSVVCDPPYEISFMGAKWDGTGIAYSVDMWREVMRVLKPGGHLLAFSGSRTYHRIACAIEDAGFEVRDQIMWIYGSGFPKSLDVSKAIDKAAGLERDVVGTRRSNTGMQGGNFTNNSQTGDIDITIASSVDAKKWQGWGTALKPSFEPLCLARKPMTTSDEFHAIESNLFLLETKLWSLLLANAVEANSMLSQNALGVACAIAQWTVESATNIKGVLCEAMGMSQFELATNTSLSIVSLWRRILVGFSKHVNTYTTETKLSMTTDWKTLSFCLSKITPYTIIQGLSNQSGLIVHAEHAERYFDAELKRLSATLELSVLAPVISQEVQAYREEGVKVEHEPIVMARKPFKGTVADNVLSLGTGAINIDGCRVMPTGESKDRSNIPAFTSDYKNQGNTTFTSKTGKYAGGDPNGRWPANLIHDGSDEVIAAFPNAVGQQGDLNETGKPRPSRVAFGDMAAPRSHKARNDAGSAARFFYCAKASRKDRNEGLECPGPQFKHNSTLRDIENTPRKGNFHPTVKPVELMRYLCRLVTPPNGVVLDPFMGSGSTGKGAILEGFSFIGIEKEADYFQIAQARINHVANFELVGTNG